MAEVMVDDMDLHNSRTYLADLDVAIQHTVDLENLKGKSVVITGATGTIGSFVTDVLLRYNQTSGASIHVIAAGRNAQKLESQYGKFKGFQELLTEIQKQMEEENITQYDLEETLKKILMFIQTYETGFLNEEISNPTREINDIIMRSNSLSEIFEEFVLSLIHI